MLPANLPKRALPGVIERDEHQKFPTEQVKKMGELGFLGMMVSPEYGGGGMDTVSYVLAMEEISKVDASCSVIMSVNNSLVCWGLEQYGTEEQKQKYLPRLCPAAKSSAPSASRARSRLRRHHAAHHRRGHGRPLPPQRHQELDYQRHHGLRVPRDGPNQPRGSTAASTSSSWRRTCPASCRAPKRTSSASAAPTPTR